MPTCGGARLACSGCAGAAAENRCGGERPAASASASPCGALSSTGVPDRPAAARVLGPAGSATAAAGCDGAFRGPRRRTGGADCCAGGCGPGRGGDAGDLGDRRYGGGGGERAGGGLGAA